MVILPEQQRKQPDITVSIVLPADLWTEGRTAPDEAASAVLLASWATVGGQREEREGMQGFLFDHIFTANHKRASQMSQ